MPEANKIEFMECVFMFSLRSTQTYLLLSHVQQTSTLTNISNIKTYIICEKKRLYLRMAFFSGSFWGSKLADFSDGFVALFHDDSVGGWYLKLKNDDTEPAKQVFRIQDRLCMCLTTVFHISSTSNG